VRDHDLAPELGASVVLPEGEGPLAVREVIGDDIPTRRDAGHLVQAEGEPATAAESRRRDREDTVEVVVPVVDPSDCAAVSPAHEHLDGLTALKGAVHALKHPKVAGAENRFTPPVVTAPKFGISERRRDHGCQQQQRQDARCAHHLSHAPRRPLESNAPRQRVVAAAMDDKERSTGA
jgi:hypothetical protein